jgi:hypothetical protein
MLLIDLAVPADRNITQKEAEKKPKYKSLHIEMQRKWNMRFMIMPVIIWATGMVTKGLKKNVEAILGKQSTHLLQKTAIPGTSYIQVC